MSGLTIKFKDVADSLRAGYFLSVEACIAKEPMAVLSRHPFMRIINFTKSKLFYFFLLSLMLQIFLQISSSIAIGWAATYYVAKNGNDSYNGLYSAYQGGSNGPFRTINRAAHAVKAGDSVQIRGGTYQEASTWKTNGTEANPITITSYNGENVIIDGSRHRIPSGIYGVLFKIAGNWYTVTNLEICYSSWYGMTITGNHCTVRNVYSHHNWSSGIIMSGWYGLVESCRAYNNSLINAYFRPHQGTWGFGISACRYPQHTILRKNIAWDNWGEGISTFESYYITIEDNISYNNQQNFYISDTKYVLFQRNLSYCTPGNMIQDYVTQNGILVGDEKYNPPSSDNTIINNLVLGGERNIAVGGPQFKGTLIANNTFVNAAKTAGAESACVYFFAGKPANARFTNNIILQEDDTPICHLEAIGINFSHNNWSKTPPSAAAGKGDVIGDPKLAKSGPTGPGSLTPEWFKILESSSVRHRANILAQVVEDFFRTPRGRAPDIGAHEIPTQETPPLD